MSYTLRHALRSYDRKPLPKFPEGAEAGVTITYKRWDGVPYTGIVWSLAPGARCVWVHNVDGDSFHRVKIDRKRGNVLADNSAHLVADQLAELRTLVSA